MALYAFDGTWNFRDLKDEIEHIQSPQYGVDRAAARDTVETNVCRFKEFYGDDDAEYLQGVGTRFSWLGRVFGGAFGVGGKYRVRQMYRRLTERYFAGDQVIDIVGFSRGAALAVHFANVITEHGLRNPANPRHLAWKYFPELGWTFRHPKATSDDVAAPTIDFIGLFDTVATFGLPIRPFRNRGKWWRVWTIPANVKATFHAMALDEVRATFALVRPQPQDEYRKALYEVWFRGAHSNVGGGYPDRGLSDIALAWMMEMAIYQWRKMQREIPARFEQAIAMLDPNPSRPPDWVQSTLESLEPDPDGNLGRPVALRRDAWRELPADAKVHHSVFLRQKNWVSDYGDANRPLLRRVPRSARRVNDPPFFYGGTRQRLAEELANEAFGRIPVRPRSWLMRGEDYIFRSDHWVAIGTRRGRDDYPIEKTDRSAFVSIAAEWLLSGRPADPAELQPPQGVESTEDWADAKRWIVPVLTILEPYLRVQFELDGHLR